MICVPVPTTMRSSLNVSHEWEVMSTLSILNSAKWIFVSRILNIRELCMLQFNTIQNRGFKIYSSLICNNAHIGGKIIRNQSTNTE